jgi:hypothetical protein
MDAPLRPPSAFLLAQLKLPPELRQMGPPVLAPLGPPPSALELPSPAPAGSTQPPPTVSDTPLRPSGTFPFQRSDPPHDLRVPAGAISAAPFPADVAPQAANIAPFARGGAPLVTAPHFPLARQETLLESAAAPSKRRRHEDTDELVRVLQVPKRRATTQGIITSPAIAAPQVTSKPHPDSSLPPGPQLSPTEPEADVYGTNVMIPFGRQARPAKRKHHSMPRDKLALPSVPQTASARHAGDVQHNAQLRPPSSTFSSTALGGAQAADGKTVKSGPTTAPSFSVTPRRSTGNVVVTKRRVAISNSANPGSTSNQGNSSSSSTPRRGMPSASHSAPTVTSGTRARLRDPVAFAGGTSPQVVPDGEAQDSHSVQAQASQPDDAISSSAMSEPPKFPHVVDNPTNAHASVKRARQTRREPPLEARSLSPVNPPDPAIRGTSSSPNDRPGVATPASATSSAVSAITVATPASPLRSDRPVATSVPSTKSSRYSSQPGENAARKRRIVHMRTKPPKSPLPSPVTASPPSSQIQEALAAARPPSSPLALEDEPMSAAQRVDAHFVGSQSPRPGLAIADEDSASATSLRTPATVRRRALAAPFAPSLLASPNAELTSPPGAVERPPPCTSFDRASSTMSPPASTTERLSHADPPSAQLQSVFSRSPSSPNFAPLDTPKEDDFQAFANQGDLELAHKRSPDRDPREVPCVTSSPSATDRIAVDGPLVEKPSPTTNAQEEEQNSAVPLDDDPFEGLFTEDEDEVEVESATTAVPGRGMSTPHAAAASLRADSRDARGLASESSDDESESHSPQRKRKRKQSSPTPPIPRKKARPRVVYSDSDTDEEIPTSNTEERQRAESTTSVSSAVRDEHQRHMAARSIAATPASDRQRVYVSITPFFKIPTSGSRGSPPHATSCSRDLAPISRALEHGSSDAAVSAAVCTTRARSVSPIAVPRAPERRTGQIPRAPLHIQEAVLARRQLAQQARDGASYKPSASARVDQTDEETRQKRLATLRPRTAPNFHHPAPLPSFLDDLESLSDRDDDAPRTGNRVYALRRQRVASISEGASPSEDLPERDARDPTPAAAPDELGNESSALPTYKLDETHPGDSHSDTSANDVDYDVEMIPMSEVLPAVAPSPGLVVDAEMHLMSDELSDADFFLGFDGKACSSLWLGALTELYVDDDAHVDAPGLPVSDKESKPGERDQTRSRINLPLDARSSPGPTGKDIIL